MMINNLVHELPRVQKVLQMVSSLNGKVKRVVDLGCGNGEITVIFKQKLGAKEVYGVDIDEKAILLAERRGIKVYRVNLNENKLPFSDEFFDLAVSRMNVATLLTCVTRDHDLKLVTMWACPFGLNLDESRVGRCLVE